jgi:predicted Fe-Mo cluster-binding NifX family protein
MKIAFTTKGDDWDSEMDPRFGRTPYLLFYDEEKDETFCLDNRDTAEEAHGAGPRTAQRLFDQGPRVLITGNGPGGNAARVLESAGIEVYIGAGEMKAKDALDAYRAGKLERF